MDAARSHPTQETITERPRMLLIAQIAFVAACAICILLPLVGMIWAPTMETTENRVLKEMPTLIDGEGNGNPSYLSDLGSYFEDHFAYRNQMVALNAYLRTGLLATSPSPSVIFGGYGRLFYEGTLGEYRGSGILSERGASNVAFNLMLMQGYVEAQGASFAFAIAPNKNSLYPEAMPYYEVAGEVRSIDVLMPYLEEQDIRYVDLFMSFQEQGEDLYYLRDSHWNSKGALLVADELIDGLGRIQFDGLPEASEGEQVEDYVGDLNRMLYPAWQVPEEDFIFPGVDWSYVEGEAVDDSWIQTRSGLPENMVIDATLLMYRDSFANNLIPFMSTAYEHAYYSKWVPYDLTQVSDLGATDVIIERAERHISDLNASPAIMPAPRFGLELSHYGEADGMASVVDLTVVEDGPYLKVSGSLPPDSPSDVQICIRAVDPSQEVCFVPFRVGIDGNDFGFLAYLESDSIALDTVFTVYGIKGSDIVSIGTFDREGKVLG